VAVAVELLVTQVKEAKVEIIIKLVVLRPQIVAVLAVAAEIISH
jgi:hypothetical protein